MRTREEWERKLHIVKGKRGAQQQRCRQSVPEKQDRRPHRTRHYFEKPLQEKWGNEWNANHST